MMRHACALVVVVALASTAFAKEAKVVVVTPSPEEQAAAEAAAQKAAVESIRAQAQVEKDIQEAIAQLSTPSYERATQRLLAIGAPAVPYLIEAMSDKTSGAFPAEAYPLAGPGRSTRTMSLKEAAFGVLTSLYQNRSNYSGALPGLDATAWREFWTQTGANVQFGKSE
jgi:hypothetical protein